MGDTKFRQTGRRTARGPFRSEARDLRRKEGEERNAAWRSLSVIDQARSLQARRGSSKRQRAALGMA